MAQGTYTYDQATDSLIDGQRLVWARVKDGEPPTPTPVTSPGPTSAQVSPHSPRPGEATFTSVLNGISIDYPAGWQARQAIVPWLGEALSFDSPAADVIFDPALGDRLYLIVASQPYLPGSGDGWRDGVLTWTCTDGFHEFWGWDVEGFHSEQFGPCDSGSLIQTFSRGYLIRLVASSDEPGLAETYDWDWLKTVLETVDLRPETAPAVPECIDYRTGGTYTQAVDPLQVTVTLPAGTEHGWWAGTRDVFAAASESCVFDPAVQLEVSGLFQVHGDACKWRGTAVDVRSRDGAAATLRHNGLESTLPTDATVGGFPASQFEISVPNNVDLAQCDGERLRLWDSGPGRDATIDPDETVRVYLVDVDGLTLGVTLTWSPGDVRLPAKMAELDNVLASMRIEPQGAAPNNAP
jgi:hypothetical protein